MIILKKPYIKTTNSKSKLIFELLEDDKEKEVWFEVDNEYKDYLCDDRVDAIFIGILNYALRKGHDIKSDSYITDDILYKVKEYLIPSLVKYSENLKNINIDIKTKPAIKNAGKVGTGCSCGIDSLHGTLMHYKKENKSYNVTHLCINNVGAFNDCYKESGIDKVRKIRIEKSKEFAKEIGLPLIITNSNFQQEIEQQHNLTHTYSSSFAIHCMQKLWSKYYYGSSGMDFSAFDLQDNDTHDSSKYELLSLDCFSTSNLKIFSEGGAQNRVEKTKDIYNEKLLKKHLHVCTIKEYNCSVCPKCMRTILTLYALNDDMNQYKDIFDIDHFNQNKSDYFDWLYGEHCYDIEVTKPVYEACLKRKEFYDYVHDKEETRLKYLESQNKDTYKEEYEKIVNSKSYKLMNKALAVPRKIKNIKKPKEKH